jgi:dolichyl-diphosphooligosaccharide--protein glycosyltransferase
MTDYQMAGGKFGAMAIWNDSTAQLAPYYYVLVQDSLGQPSVVQAYSPEYYNTLTVRLQNFDGSMTEPGSVVAAFTEVRSGYNYPVITSVAPYNSTEEAQAAIDQYNAAGSSGNRAYLISNHQGDAAKSLLPSVRVPALQHFRLVHESPDYVTSLTGQYSTVPTQGSTAWVKSFEYVPGAVIKGAGVIEVPVVTNNGRVFTYRQESVGGQFIVPYSTAGNPYEVRTLGPYTIAGTGKTFEVSEEAVMNGLTVN